MKSEVETILCASECPYMYLNPPVKCGEACKAPTATDSTWGKPMHWQDAQMQGRLLCNSGKNQMSCHTINKMLQRCPVA